MKNFFKLFLSVCFISYSFIAMSQPVVSFTVTEACAPVNITFTNTSVGCVGSAIFDWSAGTGDVSNNENPVFSYTTGGDYIVTLTVHCDGFDVSKTMNITVFDPPTVAFSDEQIQLCVGDDATFTDLSTPGDGTIDTWLWYFGDGNTSSAQNTQHPYNSSNLYNVSLVVTDNNECSSQVTHYGLVSVAALPVVYFYADNTNNCSPPLDVYFTSNVTTSFGLNSYYSWDFGDGHTSTAANPSNTYTASGLYDVTLTVTDEYGCETSVPKEEYIRITDPEALYTITEGDVVCYGIPAHFVNQTSYSCLWDFGDGSTSSQNPATHTYTVPGQIIGTFTVDPGGPCETSVPMNVFVEQIDASFITNPTNLFSCTAPFNVQFTGTSTSNNPGGTLSYTYTFANTDNVNGQNVSYQFENTGLSSVSLVVMSEAGCIDMAFTSVYISDLSATFTSDVIEGCEPLEVNFNYAGTVTPPTVITNWYWDFGNGQSSSNANTSTSVFNEGTYNVILNVTDNNDCTATETVEINVGYPYNPNIGVTDNGQTHPPLTGHVLCAQDTVSFYLDEWDNEDYEFTWWVDSANNVDPTDLYTDYAFDQQPGTNPLYIISNYNGCIDTIYYDTYYISGPIINSIEAEKDCDFPRNYVFTLNDTLADTWDWKIYYLEGVDTVFLAHDFASTELSYPISFPLSPDSFWVKVIAHSDTTECAFIDSLQVTITSPEAVFSLGLDDEICANDSFSFDGSGSQNVDEYLWDFGDGTDSGWSSTPFSDHIFNQVGPFVVKLTVKDSNGCEDTVSDVINIMGPVLTVDPGIIIGCNTLDAVFTVAVETIDPLEWITLDYGDGQHYTDQNPFEFTYNHTYLNPGVYSATVTAQTSAECDAEFIVTDIIVSSVSANFEISPVAACVGENINFSADETNPLFSYTWDFGDGPEAGNPSNDRSFSSGGIKNITLHVVNEYNCFGDFADNVTIQQAFAEFNLDPSSYPCYPVDPTIHQLSTALPGGTPLTYEWITAMGIINGGESPVIHYTSAGNSSIVLNVTTPLGCTDTYSQDITIEGPYGEVNISKTEACVGEKITFEINNSENLDSCNWVVGGGDSYNELSFPHSYDAVPPEGYYPVFLTMHSGDCHPSFEYQVWVYDITAAALITDTEGFVVEGDTACTPFNGILTSTTENADSLTWFINGTEYGSHGETESYTFENSGVTDQTVTINLAVKDSHGCRDTAEINFGIYPLPQITITNDTIICNGDAVTIYASGGEGCTYSWSPDEAISDVNIQSPAINPGSDITYYVDVLSQHNCLNSDSVNIVVQQEPEIFLLPELDTVIIGDTVFAILTADQENLSFIWTPQEFISCVSCPEPYFIPEESMRYTLTVEDSMHCFRYNYYMDIVVVEKYTLDVPGAFTPLGAEANRIVYVNGYGIRKLLQFRIYNRWGEEVFFTDDIRKGWDGYYNGQLQNIDNYSYYVEAEMFNGQVQSKKGQIMLIR